MNEVRFLQQQAGPHETSQILADDYIMVEPFARMNHSYKFYAETDVYEAIAAVRKHYNIDPERIVIRGHSMGGHQGSARLAIQNPTFFAAFEVERWIFRNEGIRRPARPAVKELTPYQEAALHYVDAEDYALNAFNVPFVSYGGEKDAQLRASIRFREAVEREGFKLTKESPYKWTTTDLRGLFLIGPATGHAWHKESKAESEAFLRKAIDETAGKVAEPRAVRHLHDAIQQRALGDDRAARGKLQARRRRREADRRHAAVHRDDEECGARAVRRAGRVVHDRRADASRRARIRCSRRPTASGPSRPARPPGFARSTGCRGRLRMRLPTGSSPCAEAASRGTKRSTTTRTSRFDSFRSEFAKWMRGDIRVKDDKSVSAADIANYNLVLFGDPGSNVMIAKVLGGLPIQWTKSEITVGAQKFPTADHALVLIYPNPLNPQKYVVLNTGQTFSANRITSGTEAVFFPRLGDYAVLTTGGRGEDRRVLR